MMTVVDQVSPWLTPSRTFAASTQFHESGPHEHERHGRRDDPACDEHTLATPAISGGPGDVVRHGLRHAEDDDERKHGRPCREVELLLGNRRQDAALHARPSRRRTR